MGRVSVKQFVTNCNIKNMRFFLCTVYFVTDDDGDDNVDDDVISSNKSKNKGQHKEEYRRSKRK